MKSRLAVIAMLSLWSVSACSSDLNSDHIVGKWSGSIEVPEGSSCIEGCERSITFRENHTFKTSDACPGWIGTWKVRDGNVVELMPTRIPEEDGTTSCFAGSEFKPWRATLDGADLRVEAPDDETTILRRAPSSD